MKIKFQFNCNRKNRKIGQFVCLKILNCGLVCLFRIWQYRLTLNCAMDEMQRKIILTLAGWKWPTPFIIVRTSY